MVNKPRSLRYQYSVLIITCLTLVFMLVALTTIGSVRLSLSEVWAAIITPDSGVHRTIVLLMRLPRNVLTILVGANLAVAGVLMQAVMKNPLADPGITGVSSGAALVAIFILLAAPQWIGFMPLFAFIGGAIACAMVFSLAWKDGISPLRIILSGVAVNSIISGFISLLSIIYSDQIHGALLWLNGSLSGSTWADVQTLLPYTLVGLIGSFFLIRSANVLQLGDDSAKNLGYNVNHSRLLLSAVAVFLAGVTTSVVGVIGFVGLIVPHVARMIMGNDHKLTIPFSMALGGSILLVADTIGRSAFGAWEIPVGIITSIVGGPFFLFLLRKRG